jgi:hypothetical protein
MVLRVLLCAELMFWLCCLVGFVRCNTYIRFRRAKIVYPYSPSYEHYRTILPLRNSGLPGLQQNKLLERNLNLG